MHEVQQDEHIKPDGDLPWRLALCPPPAHSQLEDPWRLLPIQALVDIGMKDMKA